MNKILSVFGNFNILRVGLFTLIFAIPLIPKFPLFNVTGTYVAIRIEDFLLASFGFFWLISFFSRKNFGKFFSDNLNLVILLYLMVGAVSLLSAIFITKSVIPHLGLLHYLRRIEYFFPFFLAIFAIKGRNDIKAALVVLFISTIGVILYGVGQLYFGFPVISTSNEEFSKGLLLPLTEGGRVNSTFAGHYDLAAYLAIVLVLILAFLARLQPFKKDFLKLGVPILIFGIFCYWLLVTTESRIAFVAILTAFPLVLYLLGRKVWILPVILLVFAGLLMSPNLAKRFILTFSYGVEFVQKKLQSENVTPFVFAQVSKPPVIQQSDLPSSTQSTKSAEVVTAKTEKPAPGEPENLFERIVLRSGGIRFNVEWPRAIRAFLKNPIFGTGYSSITLATDNDYLRSLGETGALGFLSFLLIFVEIGRRIIAFSKLKIDNWSRAVVVGLVGVMVVMAVNAVFIDVFEASKVAIIFWALMGILVATIKLSYQKNVAGQNY